MKVSRAFVEGLLELCLEICKDNGWVDILANIENKKIEVFRAMTSRNIGEYAADVRAKLRRHKLEQERMENQSQGVPGAPVLKSAGKPPALTQDKDGEGTSADSTMRDFNGMIEAAPFRAVWQENLPTDVDLRALTGMPSPHERIVVVVSQPRTLRSKIHAIRDTGSPFTMISSGLG